MNLFMEGRFKLASGRPSSWKVECDALTKEDWAGLARIASGILPAFGTVHGVPTGGLRFAAALQRYRIEGFERVLIVDDVWTTGGSMRKFAAEIVRPGWDWIGCVAFSRGPVTPNVYAVWSLGLSCAVEP